MTIMLGRKKAISVKKEEVSVSEKPAFSARSQLLNPKNLIIIGLLVLVVVLWKFKGYFIAATINGAPISRFELNNQLTRRFGQQTLENLINERLILSAARQKGIFITSDEIAGRVKQVEERLAGQTTLVEALKAQGLTDSMFKRQIEIQISIEKMFEKDATVSAKDIDDYVKNNSAFYKESTDPAKVRTEVEANLKQQKISELFDPWFAEIRKNASVKSYL